MGRPSNATRWARQLDEILRAAQISENMRASVQPRIHVWCEGLAEEMRATRAACRQRRKRAKA